MLAALLAAPCVIASPADKATARELATEGITLYNEGDCVGAIDRLERAEQLYSAPVHLLYIARCQAKLGRLIEAAETYRIIKRMDLPAQAPSQFKAAQKDADRELDVVTAEIPRLILNVAPQPEGLTITINGVAVSEAVLGVERLTNPGAQEIKVTAAGFEPSEKVIQLKRSEVREIEIPLLPLGGKPPPSVGDAADAADKPADGEPAESGEPGEPGEPGESGESRPGPNGIIWFVGARLGLFAPGGNAGKFKFGLLTRNIPMTDVAGAGGGGELLGGLTFERYFTPFVFFTGYALASANPKEQVFGSTGQGAGGIMVGAGMRFGSPRRQLGGFGEAAFARNAFAMERTGVGAAGAACTVTLASPSVRLGGGMTIPVSDLVELTPALNFTFGKFTQSSVSGPDGCAVLSDLIPESIPSANQGSYMIFQIGIGGEFVFGGHE